MPDNGCGGVLQYTVHQVTGALRVSSVSRTHAIGKNSNDELHFTYSRRHQLRYSTADPTGYLNECRRAIFRRSKKQFHSTRTTIEVIQKQRQLQRNFILYSI